MIDHEDRIEQLRAPFYIRWQNGPDYERALLCLNDGEPDTLSFALVSFKEARMFKAGLQALEILLFDTQDVEKTWGPKLDSLMAAAGRNELLDRDDNLPNPAQDREIDRMETLRSEIIRGLAAARPPRATVLPAGEAT